MMKGFNLGWRLICIILILSGLFACNRSPGTKPDGGMALSVNGSVISIREFNEQIKLDAYADPEMEITRETRERFADYLIQRELMLQEAVRLKLDQRTAFVQAMERYWESTLIRNLLDVKTAEVKQNILVNREEIETYYLAHQDEFGRPFDEVKESIQSILETRHLEKKLENWTTQLRTSADITVNHGYIKGE
ncbi:MAG: SurA N-terminal domain-containing protein [Desulfobacter sp.]|nr:MAG: SurA N-terminal domain-containing protein [Desulfobacter sp.]